MADGPIAPTKTISGVLLLENGVDNLEDGSRRAPGKANLDRTPVESGGLNPIAKAFLHDPEAGRVGALETVD